MKLTREVEVINKLGMHARPASMFVRTAMPFSSTITVKKGDEIVDGKSIMGLMTFAATMGTKINITVEGDDAESCLDALEQLFLDKFNEE